MLAVFVLARGFFSRPCIDQSLALHPQPGPLPSNVSSRSHLYSPSNSDGARMTIKFKDYGFLPEETMAIGDNHNDLEMLEYAGIGVIMANCVKELKGRGFIETPSNNDLGVARALERFVLCGQ